MQCIIADDIRPLANATEVPALHALVTLAHASSLFLQVSKSGFPKPASYPGNRQAVQRAALPLTP